MLFITYKTTLKTLLRSFLLWLVICLVALIVMDYVTGITLSYTIVEDGVPIKQVFDTDPEYVLKYDKYIQQILNVTGSGVMLYAIPLLCVVSTMLVLNREYEDGFFEIQKSQGICIAQHFAGRLLAIITVNIVACLFFTFIAYNYYYFSRGGVKELQMIKYFGDHAVRLLRLFVTSSFPSILLHTGIVYMVGSIIKSGKMGAVAGFGYVLWEYCSVSTLRMRLPDIYHNYFSTKSYVPTVYWTYYDTPWFDEKSIYNPYTFKQVIVWSAIMMSFVSLFFFVSYIGTKKRNT